MNGRVYQKSAIDFRSCGCRGSYVNWPNVSHHCPIVMGSLWSVNKTQTKIQAVITITSNVAHNRKWWENEKLNTNLCLTQLLSKVNQNSPGGIATISLNKYRDKNPLNTGTEHNHSHSKYNVRQFKHNLYIYVVDVDCLEVSPAALSLKLKSPEANLAAVKQEEEEQ